MFSDRHCRSLHSWCFNELDTGHQSRCLLQAQSKLQCQVEALEEEKRIMQTVPVAASDILNLNIGGTLITTKRSTLMQVCTVTKAGTA